MQPLLERRIDEEIDWLKSLATSGDLDDRELAARVKVSGWSMWELDKEIARTRTAINRLEVSYKVWIREIAIRTHLVRERIKRIPRSHLLWAREQISSAVKAKKAKVALEAAAGLVHQPLTYGGEYGPEADD